VLFVESSQTENMNRHISLGQPRHHCHFMLDSRHEGTGVRGLIETYVRELLTVTSISKNTGNNPNVQLEEKRSINYGQFQYTQLRTHQSRSV
jgi:hypothetical protein